MKLQLAANKLHIYLYKLQSGVSVGGEIRISFQHARSILALQRGPSACLECWGPTDRLRQPARRKLQDKCSSGTPHLFINELTNYHALNRVLIESNRKNRMNATSSSADIT